MLKNKHNIGIIVWSIMLVVFALIISKITVVAKDFDFISTNSEFVPWLNLLKYILPGIWIGIYVIFYIKADRLPAIICTVVIALISLYITVEGRGLLGKAYLGLELYTNGFSAIFEAVSGFAAVMAIHSVLRKRI